METIVLIIVVFILIALSKSIGSSNKNEQKTSSEFPVEWRIFLTKKVVFYNALSQDEKTRFEQKVNAFISNYKITGIDTTVNDEDRLLVAASAIIPIFEFNNWEYPNFYEVLLYPDSFNENYETAGPDRRILGQVGTGYMEGKMILSKPALHLGFTNESDKKNTAIHEFVHLIDKADGTVDGIPTALLEKQYTIPWLDLINKKIEEIYADSSDINPYGATNRQEFFAVTSEYFFERPKLLASKHPELYAMLEKIFDQKMADKTLNKTKAGVGRNNPCVCGSGIKFKKCCGQAT